MDFCTEGKTINLLDPKLKLLRTLFCIYAAVAFVIGALLQVSGLFSRQELQTINRRFESRPWLKWSPESLKRLNLDAIIDYHNHHDIPVTFWSWDYTLSWLIENNHPDVKNKIVIFNHMLEDEPPMDAVKDHPWMTPLTQQPMSRATMGEIIEFLARSGARAILLDNDFPQYSSQDTKLARSIHASSEGTLNGRKVPVFMARTINRGSFANAVEVEIPSQPNGVLSELEKLEPGVDVIEKYTGMPGVLVDQDQVIRRFLTELPGPNGRLNKSIVVKTLLGSGKNVPSNLPEAVDVDFSCPPHSELYPVRPISYLLDPAQRLRMAHPPAGNEDVTLNDAIVIMGDNVVDIFNTPFSNEGVNMMSGSEILAHSIETISRGSWLTRLNTWQSVLYIFMSSLLAALLLVAIKAMQSQHISAMTGSKAQQGLRLALDLACFATNVFLAWLFACLLFTYASLIVPVIVPCVGLMVASLVSALFERERERLEHFKAIVKAYQEKLVLQSQKHEAELNAREAQAKAREIIKDQDRRREFARRINHDLRAPVSVLNWTLSKLLKEKIQPEAQQQKVERLARTSDKLVELINQLVSSYAHDAKLEETPDTSQSCDLTVVLKDSLMLARPIAEQLGSSVDLTMEHGSAWVRGSALSVSRIVDNLVRNALVHNCGGTHVLINSAVAQSQNKIVINISDNGKGITEADQAHVFERGWRVVSGNHQGEGLGLAIVKSLAVNLGGDIVLKSTLGEGCLFTVELPMSEVPVSDIMESERAAEVDGVMPVTKMQLLTGSGSAGATHEQNIDH